LNCINFASIPIASDKDIANFLMASAVDDVGMAHLRLWVLLPFIGSIFLSVGVLGLDVWKLKKILFP
jgi:hypothetical protein